MARDGVLMEALPIPTALAAWADPVHGGADAEGVPLHDFSTNSNACGPGPHALQALQQADATRYPDPCYGALREQLGAFHGVGAERVVLAGSASEFIHRITALAARGGARAVSLPAHAYGDYARAAGVWGLEAVPVGIASQMHAGLRWACEPSSPLGHADAQLPTWAQALSLPGSLAVIDCAYAPLRLEGRTLEWPASAWQLWTPNKALGLTGVRAAYAIAPAKGPAEDVAALRALAPSWPVGAHGVALLQAWTEPATQQWLAQCLPTLQAWKARQQALCTALGWELRPGSLANYFVARLGAAHIESSLQRLRAHGIKLRDCASFGLAGHVRLGVLPPASQDALERAWRG